MKPIILLASLGIAHALPEAPAAAFRPETIDSKVGIGYGIDIADVDGDGKPDILLVDSAETSWYANPTWEKHRLTGKLTEKDHVCICAKDINGDGKAEIAVGAEWNPGDTVNSGAVFALLAPEDRKQAWKETRLHREPTVHRMHWVREKSDSHFLAVLPLHGCNNKSGEGDGIKFLGYRPQTDPAMDWPTFLLNESLHMAHNFDPVKWGENDTAESILVAAKEGVHLIKGSGETWNTTRLTEKGAGEVRAGRLPDGKRFITTIEPMHGNEVVIYPETDGGTWTEKHFAVDETLAQGHALAAADFLGLGYDQIVAGWREPSKSDGKVGLRLYIPANEQGTEWKLHAVIDDNSMACEDLKAADLNGDGKPELIASGRATKNLVIYWNE